MTRVARTAPRTHDPVRGSRPKSLSESAVASVTSDRCAATDRGDASCTSSGVGSGSTSASTGSSCSASAALLTVGLGYGITNLEFATGQDSYLNKSDQVYKDSVAYQKLFGGQAMVTLVTMDKGHTVNELFTPENIAQWKAIEKKLHDSGKVVNVVSPLTALQFNDALVQRPGRATRPRASPARSCSPRRPRDPSPEGQAARTADAGDDARRASARSRSPSARSTTPTYVDFLLHDNQGNIRKPLLANFPDDRHAQIITRLPGNASIKDEGKAAGARPGRGRRS